MLNYRISLIRRATDIQHVSNLNLISELWRVSDPSEPGDSQESIKCVSMYTDVIGTEPLLR